jgi:hypothetical protein
MATANDSARNARCPNCGSEGFVLVWEGYTYVRGRFVICQEPRLDVFFEDDDTPEFGEGSSRYECANCETEVDECDFIGS